MRLGPLPKIMTFLLLVGSASQDDSYVEYRYGVKLSNSAEQVSTRLKTALTPSSLRRVRTAISVEFHELASCASETPRRFASISSPRSAASREPPFSDC